MRVRVARLMGGRSDDVLTAAACWLCWAIRTRGFGGLRASRSRIGELARRCRWLMGLLADKDRFVAFAARRVLEKVPAKDWQDQVLATKPPRPFLQGATGLLTAHPSPEVAHKISGAVRSDAPRRCERAGAQTWPAQRRELSRPVARCAACADPRERRADGSADTDPADPARVSDARCDDESRAGEAAGVFAAAGSGSAC